MSSGDSFYCFNCNEKTVDPYWHAERSFCCQRCMLTYFSKAITYNYKGEKTVSLTDNKYCINCGSLVERNKLGPCCINCAQMLGSRGTSITPKEEKTMEQGKENLKEEYLPFEPVRESEINKDCPDVIKSLDMLSEEVKKAMKGVIFLEDKLGQVLRSSDPAEGQEEFRPIQRSTKAPLSSRIMDQTVQVEGLNFVLQKIIKNIEV